MYVGLKMLKDFISVTPKTPVAKAKDLLEKQALGMLLVVEGEKPVGYVRKADISAALPSVMSTLEKHEALYLLSRLTVEKIMHHDMVTVHPDMEIEAAADLMYQKKLAGLAVVDSGGKLVGYINRTVMLDFLVEEMGYRQGGSRIFFEVEDRKGVLHEIAGVIKDKGVSIISTATFPLGGKRELVIRLATDDPSEIVKALEAKGYRMNKPEDFSGEWER
ncbi:MAG: CBS domain-containing protein [Thermodesulfobacteriota bacterium]